MLPLHDGSIYLHQDDVLALHDTVVHVAGGDRHDFPLVVVHAYVSTGSGNELFRVCLQSDFLNFNSCFF